MKHLRHITISRALTGVMLMVSMFMPNQVWARTGNTSFFYTSTCAFLVYDGDKEAALYSVIAETPSLSIAEYVMKDGVAYKTTAIGANAFTAYGDKITSLKVGSNINYIETGALQHLTALQDLNWSSSVPLTATMTASFKNTLQTLAIYQNVEPGAFRDFTQLTSVKGNSVSVQSIGDNAFRGCTNLTTVNYLTGLTSLGQSAFYDCSSLTSFDLAKVTGVPNYAFYGCSSLNINLPSTVTGIGAYAYAGCNATTSLQLPSGLTVLGNYAFQNCTGLKSANLATATSINVIPVGLFAGCSALTSVTLNNSISSLGAYSFQNTGITSFPSLPNLTNIGNYAFDGCHISVLNMKDGAGSSSFTVGRNAFSNCKDLKTVNWASRCTTIPQYAFSGCSLLSNVRMHYTVESIGAYAFSDCGSLATIEMPTNLSKVGEKAFYNCLGLERVVWMPKAALRDLNLTYNMWDINPQNAGVITVAYNNRTLVVPYPELEDYKTSVRFKSYFGTFTCPNPTSISMSPREITFYRGQRGYVYCNVQPEGAYPTVYWDKDENDVTSTASKFGKQSSFLGLKAGTTTLTAHSDHNPAVTTTIQVTVLDVSSLIIQGDDTPIVHPGTLQLSATASPAEADQTVTWQSSNPEIATVDANGLVTSQRAGVVTITAVTPNGVKASRQVEVHNAVVQLDATSLLLRPGESSYLHADIDGGVTWSVEDSNIATVNSDGKVTARALGVTKVTATSNYYGYAKAQCMVVVSNEQVMYVGGIYYQPIEGEEGHVRVTNLGLGQEEYYSNVDRSEYKATITIPPTIAQDGQSYTVTEVGDYAFYRMRDLQMVVIPATVKRIGRHAFEHSERMVRVTFLTGSQLATIDYAAFRGCYMLDGVVIPNGTQDIQAAAFNDCRGLHDLTLPSALTRISPMLCQGCTVLDELTLPAAVRVIGNRAFGDCVSLNTLTLPTSLSMVDEYAFQGCTALTTVTLPASVTSLQNGAYDGCTALSTVTLSAQLQGIGAMCFRGCNALSSISFTGSQPISVGESAFLGCTGLTRVQVTNLGAWAMSGFANVLSNPLTLAHHLYQGTSELTRIALPSGTTHVGQYAFYGMDGLQSLTLPTTVTAVSDSITTAPEVSVNGAGTVLQLGTRTDEIALTRSSLPLTVGSTAQLEALTGQSITWSTSNNTVATVDSQGLVKALSGGIAVITARAPSGLEGQCLVYVGNTTPVYVGSNYYLLDNEAHTATLTSMGQGQASAHPSGTDRYEYTGILSVPQSISYDGQTYAVTQVGDYALYGQRHLQMVILPASITTMGTSACEQSQHLARVRFASGSRLSTLRQRAFYRCSALDDVQLPSSLYSIQSSTFRHCTSLRSLALPSRLTDIGEYAFANCTALPSVSFPSTLSAIQNYGFSFDTALDDLQLPASTIGLGAHSFDGCTGLRHIRFSNTGVMTVGENAFVNCSALRAVDVDRLDAWVMTNFGNEYANPLWLAHHITHQGTELFAIKLPSTTLYINQWALAGCTAITRVDIPASVQSVSDDIFRGCDALTAVICRATTAPAFIGTRSTTGMATVFDRATLYVPADRISRYQADAYWRLYGTPQAIVTPIPGDADGNGQVQEADILLIVTYLLHGTAPGINMWNADCNQDGVITISDLTRAIQYAQ